MLYVLYSRVNYVQWVLGTVEMLHIQIMYSQFKSNAKAFINKNEMIMGYATFVGIS